MIALDLLNYSTYRYSAYKNLFINFVLANSYLPVEVNSIIAKFLGIMVNTNLEPSSIKLDFNMVDFDNISPLLVALKLPKRTHKRKNSSLKFQIIEKLLLSGSNIDFSIYNLKYCNDQLAKREPEIFKLLNKFAKKPQSDKQQDAIFAETQTSTQTDSSLSLLVTEMVLGKNANSCRINNC